MSGSGRLGLPQPRPVVFLPATGSVLEMVTVVQPAGCGDGGAEPGATTTTTTSTTTIPTTTSLIPDVDLTLPVSPLSLCGKHVVTPQVSLTSQCFYKSQSLTLK